MQALCSIVAVMRNQLHLPWCVISDGTVQTEAMSHSVSTLPVMTFCVLMASACHKVSGVMNMQIAWTVQMRLSARKLGVINAQNL